MKSLFLVRFPASVREGRREAVAPIEAYAWAVSEAEAERDAWAWAMRDLSEWYDVADPELEKVLGRVTCPLCKKRRGTHQVAPVDDLLFVVPVAPNFACDVCSEDVAEATRPPDMPCLMCGVDVDFEQWSARGQLCLRCDEWTTEEDRARFELAHAAGSRQ